MAAILLGIVVFIKRKEWFEICMSIILKLFLDKKSIVNFKCADFQLRKRLCLHALLKSLQVIMMATI